MNFNETLSLCFTASNAKDGARRAALGISSAPPAGRSSMGSDALVGNGNVERGRDVPSEGPACRRGEKEAGEEDDGTESQ